MRMLSEQTVEFRERFPNTIRKSYKFKYQPTNVAGEHFIQI